MTRELPANDPGFPYEEQYRTAAWRATFRAFELLGDDPVMEASARHLPPSVRELSGTALKNTVEVIEHAIATRQTPHYNDFIRYRMIDASKTDDIRVDTDLKVMAHLYSNTDEVWREWSELYDIARFDDDVELLARFQSAKLVTLIDRPSFSILEFVTRMQLDNDFYLGTWDAARLLSAPSSDTPASTTNAA
jgi:hypothetical protein